MFYGGTLAGYQRAALYCTWVLQSKARVRRAEKTQEALRSQRINCLDVFVHSPRLHTSFPTCTSSFVLLW